MNQEEIKPGEGLEKKDVEGSASLEISSKDVLGTLIAGYGKKGTEEGKEKFAEILTRTLKQITSKHEVANNYNILILFDNTRIIKSDADQIYNSVTKLENNGKPLLLILLSGGGDPGSAYLIGKLCREFCNDKFVVVVPRYAKSAATLLSCAADEIHMGSLSELGPIDPQIDGMPALGLKNSVEHIAELVNKTPESGKMFARYLNYSVPPIQIGYYERVAESATQYAEKLLESHKADLENSPAVIAYKLVYGYKDHGFVIDKWEALSIFGKKAIKNNTAEYNLGNEIYNMLSEIEEFASLIDYRFYFIGSLGAKPDLMPKKKN